MGKSSQTTPLEFLRALFQPIKGGLIELRAIPMKGSTRSPMRAWIRSGAELEDFGRKFGGKGSEYGVYFGVCKRGSKGGKKQDVMGATALWADIDCVVNGQKIDVLLRLIGEMPANIQPSAVVHSGGGLHLYWFLNEAATFASFDYSDKYTSAQIEEANRGLAHTVGGDNVADVTRVLRLPGTYNNKRRPEKECKVVYCAQHLRYHPTSLMRDVTKFGKVIDGDKWVSSKAVKPKGKAVEVSDDKIMRAINALYPAKSKPILDKFWRDRVRHSAPRGYVGIHEAIVYSTAKLHCSGDFTPERIVEKVVEWIKEVPDVDTSDWDWTAERRKVKATLDTWGPKYKQLLADERKAARGQPGKIRGDA